jgi:hypothetical protein
MNEILHVAIFDTICSFNFQTKCVHCNMQTPSWMLLYFLIQIVYFFCKFEVFA